MVRQQIATWPIIVYAYVSDGNGSYQIATEPVNLEVADKFFNFGFPKTSAELNASADVLVDVDVNREFEGTCEVELVGFPAGVTCENPKAEVKNDTEQISFAVKIGEKARVGQHKTLSRVRATITSDKGRDQTDPGHGRNASRQTDSRAGCQETGTETRGETAGRQTGSETGQEEAADVGCNSCG